MKIKAMLSLTSTAHNLLNQYVRLNIFTCVFAFIGHNLYQVAIGWAIQFLQWFCNSFYNIIRTFSPVTRPIQLTPLHPNTQPIKISSKMTLSHTDVQGIERSIKVHTTQDSGATDIIMSDPRIATNIGIDATVQGNLVNINGKPHKEYIVSYHNFPYKIASPTFVDYINIRTHQNIPPAPGQALQPLPNAVNPILIGEIGSVYSFSTFMKPKNYNNLMKVDYYCRFVIPFWLCMIFWILWYFLWYDKR